MWQTAEELNLPRSPRLERWDGVLAERMPARQGIIAGRIVDEFIMVERRVVATTRGGRVVDVAFASQLVEGVEAGLVAARGCECLCYSRREWRVG